ncbi:MAG: sensor histidine kinase [Lewinella sp.]|nr:sensor histidine kinase [Lewinella sp.]
MPSLSISRWFRNNLEWIIHALVWLLYFSSIRTRWEVSWVDPGLHAGRPTPFAALVAPLVFYVNALLLIPRLLRRRRWWAYGCSLLLLTLLLESLRSGVMALAGPIQSWAAAFRTYFGQDMIFYLAVFWAIFVSTAYRFTKDWLVNLRVIDRLQAEKTSAELAFLKSQVDPHFLFNTLNTLYALALEEKAPQTADAIAQLGTLMRYSLHDAQADTLPLPKVLDFLEQYLALQRLRTSPHTQLYFERPAEEEVPPGTSIAPMLLIPFIENACKYGISPTTASEVRIRITFADGWLRLVVTNPVVARPAHSGGVGLTNARERLEHHYPNRHHLDIQSTDATYRVDLQIQLTP